MKIKAQNRKVLVEKMQQYKKLTNDKSRHSISKQVLVKLLGERK